LFSGTENNKHQNKLEITHRIQTSAKEHGLVYNVKLVHNIEIGLVTKIVSIIVVIPISEVHVALFYIMQTGEKEIIFLDLD